MYFIKILLSDLLIGRFLNDNESWLDGADIEFKRSINQPCLFSSSGESRPQGRPKRTLKTHPLKPKNVGLKT